MEWFPAAFSNFLHSELLFLEWVPIKARESGLPCYFTLAEIFKVFLAISAHRLVNNYLCYDKNNIFQFLVFILLVKFSDIREC